MTRYPDDGKLHPDLSDLLREVLQAFAGLWPGVMVWAVLGITALQYPDWSDIVGYSLIVCGVLSLIYIRYREKDPPQADA